MKNSIVFKIVSIYSFLLFLNFNLIGQSALNTLSFYGPNYKLTSASTFPRYSVQLGFGKVIPNQSGAEFYNGGGIDSLLSKIYTDPVLFENIFEMLGGEFFIGSFTEAPAFENFKSTGKQIYILSAGYRLHPNLEAAIQFSQFQHVVTADFPIVVFNNSTFEPFSETGHLKTTLKNSILKISGNYFPVPDRFQPFAGVGMVYQNTKAATTEAQIKDLFFDLSTNQKTTSFGMAFQAGARVKITSGIFAQVKAEAFSMKLKNENSGWNKAISGGIGIQF